AATSNIGIGTAGGLQFSGGGTLAVDTPSAGPLVTSRTLTLGTGGGTIDVAAGDALTLFNGNWSGSGGFTKTGNGTLTVGNNYAGGTNRFNVGSDSGGPVTVAGGTLNINPTQFFTFGDNNADSLFTQTGGVVNVNASAGSYIGNGTSATPYTASLVISGGTFNQSLDTLRVGQNGSSRGILTIGGGPGTAVANINIVSLGTTATGSLGTVNLLTGGTLATSSLTRGASTGTNIVNFDGGTLRASTNTTNLLTNIATFVRSGGARLDDGGFTVAIAQNLVADPTSAGGGLTKSGTGLLRLSGINTYTGTTAVTAGTLAVASPASLPGSVTAGRWSVASGGALAVGNTFSDPVVATMLSSGGLAAGSSFGFDTTAGDRIYVPAITNTAAGGLGLVKTGANTLTLAGANTYTGPTVVAEGTLRFASPNSSSLYGGTLANWTAGNLTARSGATLVLPVADLTSGQVNTVVGNLLAGNTSGVLGGSTLGLDQGFSTGTLTLSAPITGNTGTGGGAVGLLKAGDGTLVLNGNNTFTALATTGGGLDLGGGTTTSAAAVTIGAASAVGDTLANGTLVAPSLTISNPVWDARVTTSMR
ncbi:MAG: hypothetical protein EBX35_13585, partial [Planctomycetia bacterium]|nr:hypothetical protein [Planctomycetia bacterium]